jgi:hypothetical protein
MAAVRIDRGITRPSGVRMSGRYIVLLLLGFIGAALAGCDRTERAKASTEAATTQDAAAAAAPTETRVGPITVREKPVGAFPKNAAPSAFSPSEADAPYVAFSPDLRHWAAVARDARGDTLVVDGKPGKTYPQIHNVVYTAAGRLVCVVGGCFESGGVAPANDDLGKSMPGQCLVAVDGVEGPRFDSIAGQDDSRSATWRNARNQGLTVSADGKHVAYTAVRGGKSYLVVDGVESGPYAAVYRLVFSPDGTRFACLTRDETGGKATPLVDGKPQPDLAGEACNLCFSPDGKSFALARGTADTPIDEYKILVRGALNATFPSHGEPFVFSPDGRHIVSTPAVDGGDVLAIDGKVVKGQLPGAAVTFSADGSKVIATFDGRRDVFRLDGTKVETTQGKWISPDGKRTVGVVNSIEPRIDLGGGAVVNLPEQAFAHSYRFGPDGRFFFHAIRSDRPARPTKVIPQTVFLEDKESPDYDQVDAASVSFSDKGEHMAYVARRDGKWLVALDLQDLPGRYELVARSPLVSDAPGSLRTLAVRDGVVWSVEIKAP